LGASLSGNTLAEVNLFHTVNLAGVVLLSDAGIGIGFFVSGVLGGNESNNSYKSQSFEDFMHIYYYNYINNTHNYKDLLSYIHFSNYYSIILN
jgi:hypothetical protein